MDIVVRWREQECDLLCALIDEGVISMENQENEQLEICCCCEVYFRLEDLTDVDMGTYHEYRCQDCLSCDC